jgi:peptide/nickel transport system permease protein
MRSIHHQPSNNTYSRETKMTVDAMTSSTDSQKSRFARPESLWRFYMRRFVRHRMALFGAIVLAFMTVLVYAAPITARYDPNKQDLRARFEPPSMAHWMGTDDLGRDIWARVMYGGRISFTVGLLAVAVVVAFGSIIGVVSGYYGGWVDSILSRITEVFMSVPRLFILLTLGMMLRALNLSWLKAGSFLPIALVIGLLSWTSVARLVRAATLELREREYVQAARALGASDFRILFLHILPHVASPIIVSATLGLSGAIISESGLSYLGFGVQLPTPTWGNMLSNTQNQMTVAPWTAIFPGLMIFIVVIAINYLGDGLRDALDPRHVGNK